MQNVATGSEADADNSGVQSASFVSETESELKPIPSADTATSRDSGATSAETLPSYPKSETASEDAQQPSPEELPPSFDSDTTSLLELPDSCENSAQLSFCQFFDDPVLTSLIHQALAGNQELKILTEDIRIASNEVRGRRGELFPFFGWGTRAGLEKPSLFTPQGAVEAQLEVLPGKGFPDPLPNFLVATDITWEVDIWRRLRNARDAATLRYLGSANGRNYIVTRLVAEVAENYYELLALDNQMLTLDRTIEIQQKSLELAKAMKAAARGTELAVQRFQAEVSKNQSEKLIIQQRIVEVENKINFTLGRYPQPVERISTDYINLNLHALRVGVPSQLLRYRADIREAEREVAAAGLDVRVARARFFPSLILSAGAGYEAFNTRYLFSSPDSLIYGVAGNLVGPLINKSAIRADYMTANAMQLQAIYNYQRTVLNAYTEVVNRISKVENYAKSIEAKKQQLASLESSVESATKLFQTARGEYLDVLLSQRDMMEARMILIETKQQQLSAIVNAYQALGGGMMPNAINLFAGACPAYVVSSSPQPEAIPTIPEPTPDPIPELRQSDLDDSQAADERSPQLLPPAEPLAESGPLLNHSVAI
ncbi:TolC family protein [Bythopirellula polymerisocia]|nr:TolC family protein [Bythopirellula polymerisocia]